MCYSVDGGREEATQETDGERTLSKEDVSLGARACGKVKGGTGPSWLGLGSGAEGFPPTSDLCPSGPEAADLPTPNTWVLTTACSLSGSRAVTDTGLRLDSRACT